MDTKLFVLVAVTALSLVSTSCLGNRGRAKVAKGDGYNYQTGDEFEDTSDPLPSYTPNPEDEELPGEPMPPVLRERVEETGYTETSLTVQTGRKLRVRFTPGIQDKNVAGTGFMAHYSKLGVYITVGSMTQPTPMLSNGYFGGEAMSSNVMDFSASISAACPTTDCRQEVTITISRPNSDARCLIGNYQECPYNRQYSTHPWNGMLEIETNDTEALQ